MGFREYRCAGQGGGGCRIILGETVANAGRGLLSCNYCGVQQFACGSVPASSLKEPLSGDNVTYIPGGSVSRGMGFKMLSMSMRPHRGYYGYDQKLCNLFE